MTPPEMVEPTADEKGYESHPSYGWCQVNRVQCGAAGVSLFDSELRHHEIVELRIGRATRKRELKRDWIHGEARPSIVVVRMSRALVSSFGSSGVPVTLERVDGTLVPDAPHDPRLALSTAEVEAATDDLIAGLTKAVEALRAGHEEKAGRTKIAALLRDVEIRLGNARSNARFSAESFTEHVENVVTKARADIEAMVTMAADRQIDAGGIAAALGAGPAEEENDGE